jgi:diguanylate cyclase (GGDEF)-like protein
MVGDQVLVQVANVLRGVVHRPGDLLARFGSHEFSVLLPATPAQTAQGMASKIRAAVLGAKIENQADVGGPYLSASVGVATLASNDDTSIHHLYDKASQSLAEDRVPGR